MKLRTRFVSNSSTSSFILCGDTTTIDAAIDMLEVIIEEENTFFDNAKDLIASSRTKQLKEAIGTLFLIASGCENPPLLLPWSCNYDTYIWKGKKGINVLTSRNHAWYFHRADDTWIETLASEGDYYNLLEKTRKIKFYDLSKTKDTEKLIEKCYY